MQRVPFGVLELHGRTPITLTPRDDGTCRAYPHTIACAVVSELAPAYELTLGSTVGVSRHGYVHIACGIFSGCQGISVNAAMVGLRALTFSRQRRISAIARDSSAGSGFRPNCIDHAHGVRVSVVSCWEVRVFASVKPAPPPSECAQDGACETGPR